jgi:CubicO group peptidase (beta-lactamase class C family)
VLSHTTGFPNWRRGALATALPPGQQFSYSGEGFVYLARVVEHLTGEPFEAFVQRTVLVPLGMTSSRFVAAADDAVPHDQWGAANDDQTAADRTRNPAAGLRTTAVDYARFVIAVLRGTGLSPAAHAQMVTPQIHVIEGGPGSIDRADPRPLRDVAWGLGWGIETTASGVTWFHWGDNDDTKAYVAAQPASGAALVVLANSGNGLSIVHELAGLALPGPHPGLAWLGYEPYDAPGRRLAHAIRLDGVDAALRDYRAGGTPRLPERVLNELGYALARAGRIPDAIAVLTQNAEDHPSSGNTHDSLGEIYELAGDLPRAIASYARSVALDPSNTHGAEALARLRALPP